MAKAMVNGVRISYEAAGDGPAVMLIHGGLLDKRAWDHQFADLATGHRVVRHDWRGYGESESGTGEFAHHEDLLALMDELRIERATLVGNSMGGGHAVETALAAPDRVERLVLVSSGLVGHVWPTTFIDQAVARVHSTVPAERLERYRVGAGAEVAELETDLDVFVEAHLRWMIAGPDRTERDLPAEVWTRAVAMFRGYLRRAWTEPAPVERQPESPADERLREIEVPALVVNGLADVPEIQAVSDLLTDPEHGIPGAQRFDMPDTGHAPHLERPAEFTTALRGFLGSVAA
ncbi:alpha/beta hydrolase [Glycomyces sp. TRM65418]|uniref:alpha/beta fold hydrolase n=1 Tax=Glycomyces sp. TRM65418 TaxID=2867006 RepID=UPI001CE4EE04|nr:alpha/beta hydrolase [Glycomyces sp. TRM65418]MCC3764705.1 alpha/beta hydrolase [Glycomyces sp. TRM65418]QZD54364.1 alpha/beta hydrolase [Glycomyces sp. TRM65418]